MYTGLTSGAVKLALVLCATLLLGAGGWFILNQQARLGALTERVQATDQLLVWERERADRFRAQVQAVQREFSPVREAVQNAVQANPEWSTSPVPSAVRDSLCIKGNCAGTGSTVPASKD